MHVLLRSLALAGLLLTTATLSHAQDSGALIMALVRKGILTDQEAEDIRAELLREAAVVPAPAFAGGKTTQRLSVGMRLQAQYAHLDTDLAAGLIDPAATNHAFLRRVYFSLRAGLVGDWAAVMTYDFASGGYDDALLEWKPRPDLVFNFGLRKVNTAFEERSTSGNIRSLERSSVTRYFVESNNGRRLAAAGYRIGAFVEGRLGNSGFSTMRPSRIPRRLIPSQAPHRPAMPPPIVRLCGRAWDMASRCPVWLGRRGWESPMCLTKAAGARRMPAGASISRCIPRFSN